MRREPTCSGAMRYLLALMIAAPIAAQVIPEIRYKISAGDLTSADAIADIFCQVNGVNSECAAATSWLARGALIMKQPDRAKFYLQRTKGMTEELTKKSSVEGDPYLATAVGATIEVEAKLFALEGHADRAVALLQSELPHWKLYAIQARIQKNLNLLTLEGKRAPILPAGAAGQPVLLFLWGHWCSDCTGQAPVIARIKQRYESKGLRVFAPTRRIGTVNDNEHATPEEEDAEIERVWRESYRGLADVPHGVDQGTMLAYGVSSTPTLVLIDRTGIVRLYCPFRMSEAELSSRVNALLQ
ncbi:MAG: TlpA family protein disulfide reductase [Acidobacteriaceae bacterium]|nr:TlpA family protein disulfide reductase [Acidobacteriaceae bacterium]MBV9778605.1 TlpA family protein disulfide reductase [Acidobacteriaceae bacterium]